MKTAAVLLILLGLAGCGTNLPSSYAVARHEAKRLLRAHEHWLAQSPRIFDIQDFQPAELSTEARGAGFVKATVSEGAVVFWTSIDHSTGQGLLIGRLTAPEQKSFEKLGFILESTATADIRKFTFAARKQPIQAADRMPGTNAPEESGHP